MLSRVGSADGGRVDSSATHANREGICEALGAVGNSHGAGLKIYFYVVFR